MSKGEVKNMAYIDIKDLKVDEEFKDLLPVLTPEELEKLENSILQCGLLDPIKIWQEPDTGEWIIIDGHNRYNILKKHKIDWHYWQDYKIMGELETREDVKQWMLEQQLGRRNLSPEEKYDIVQKFKDMFQKRAKENQSSGGKGKSNLRKVNVQKEMAKATGISVGSYYKLDHVKKHGSKEINQQLHDKEISIDKAYQMVKNPKPTEKESITPEQKIIEFDNRMNEIDKEISSLRTERETLMHRRSSLFESLDIPCELKYDFVENEDSIWMGRNCRFYIEIDGHKQIFVECTVCCDDYPNAIWIRKVPEKYKNDFIMLWKKAHKEEARWNSEQVEKRNKDFENALMSNNEKYKDFYKQCYKTLAKSVHPDEGGDTEAMKCLNQLKVMWEI